MARQRIEAGLTDNQKKYIQLLLISFQSGNLSKDAVIFKIAITLLGSKRLNRVQLDDLETVIENTGVVEPEKVGALVGLIKKRHSQL